MAGPHGDRADAWLSAFVEAASRPEEARRVAAQIDAAILAASPELAADPALVAELHASTHAHFRTFIVLLQRTRPELLLPPQAVDLALSIARRQMDLGVLLKVYRVADQSVWDYFKEATEPLAGEGTLRTDVLIYLWERGRLWINGSIEQLIGVFTAEREASMHSMLARRSEAVHEVLRGGQVAVDKASAELRYQLRGNHLALVLWVDPDHGPSDALAHINAAAESFAAHLGCGSLLLLPVGNLEAWAWLPLPLDAASPNFPAPSTTDGGPATVRIAAGMPAAGLAGFRQSHREAVDTQRLMAGSGAGASFASYADVELVSLVSGRPAAIKPFIDRELAALAAPGPVLAKVRETLLSFLVHGGNVDAAAAQLLVHKNTVRYRLAQAGELVGHPLTERRTQMEVALRCLEMDIAAGNNPAPPTSVQKYKTGGPAGSPAPSGRG